MEAQLPQLPEALGKRPRTADPAQRLQRSRERKCFHAKRSRLRKKFFLQSLQALRADMERRNIALAAAVTAHLPPDVVAECALRDPAHAAPSLEVARFAMIAHAKRTAGLCFERGGDDPSLCALSTI